MGAVNSRGVALGNLGAFIFRFPVCKCSRSTWGSQNFRLDLLGLSSVVYEF